MRDVHERTAKTATDVRTGLAPDVEVTQARRKIPRDRDDDYTPGAAAARRAFLREQTGVALEHVSESSFDPAILPGNIEHFIGVAQVPIGVAGPLLVDGEHAQGEFYVPLATTEGTLVASYNRGMKMLREAGGVTTTILDDAMQRAPAFVFESAREARAFGEWLTEHFAEIKQAAEATTRTGRLRGIEQYSASRILFTRFDYTTGDAAGQNLTGKATAAACAWITANYTGHHGLPAGVELRHRQEELAGQHPAHAWQAGGRRGEDSRRADRGAHAHERREAVPCATGVESRRLHGRRQQQRSTLG